MNMLPSQNRSNCAFRFGFHRLATDSTAQSGFKSIDTYIWQDASIVFKPQIGKSGSRSRMDLKLNRMPILLKIIKKLGK
jgi:hypothetical protein